MPNFIFYNLKKNKMENKNELWEQIKPFSHLKLKEISKITGISKTTVHRILKEKNLNYKTESEKLKNLRKYSEHLLQEKNIMKEKINLIDFLNKKNDKPIKIIPQKNTEEEQTAFVVASDWHIEENIRPETIHNLNEYNLKIAHKRAENFFVNSAKLIKKQKNVKNIILALAGDFISGYIHPELEESNEVSPPKAIYELLQMFRSGLNYWKKEFKNIPIKIPCVVGNHGRIGLKRKISTAVDNSFEWLFYKILSNDFPEFDFMISDGKVQYLEVYGKSVRITHGDQIRGGNGIGGITVPVLRKFAKWDNSIDADLNIIGHFHQFSSNFNYVINGSMIGYNAFAEEIGASPERPAQAFFLFDKKHGRTITAPIFLDN